MKTLKESTDRNRNRLWKGLALTIVGSAALLVWWKCGLNPDPRHKVLSEQREVSGKDVSPGVPNRPERTTVREADRQLKAEGVKTDVSLTTFPIKEYQHLPAPAGKPASSVAGEAYIHVPSASRRVAMESNQIGEFPAIETKLNDTVGVRLSLDSVKPGTPVRVVIMDGGSFPAAEGVAQVLKAAKWGGVAFEFSTSGNIGFHRVLVQAQGQPSRVLNFSAHDGDTWPAPSTASSH